MTDLSPEDEARSSLVDTYERLIERATFRVGLLERELPVTLFAAEKTFLERQIAQLREAIQVTQSKADLMRNAISRLA